MFEPSCAFEGRRTRIEGHGDILLPRRGWSVVRCRRSDDDGRPLPVRLRVQLPQNKDWARRMRKAGFIMGSILCSLAVLDRLLPLPTSASSEGLATMFPSPSNLGLFKSSCRGRRHHGDPGPKYWEAEAVAQTRDKLSDAEKRRGYSAVRSSAMKVDKRTMERVERSRFLQSDKDLAMSRRRSNLFGYGYLPLLSGCRV